MKQLLLVAALCAAFVTASHAQCNTLIVDNQTNYTIYYSLYGDQTCDVGFGGGVYQIAGPNQAMHVTNTALPGCGPGCEFAMAVVYDGDPNWTGSPCTAGTANAWVSGCNVQGIGSSSSLSYRWEEPGPLCALGGTATVIWTNSSPTPNTCTVRIQ